MSALNQIAAVSAMNMRSLPQRIGTSSVVVIGIAGVVAVLISVLAMSTGFIRTLQKTGPENRAIVVRTGSSTELVSVLTNEAALTIADSAGVKKGSDGRPLASPETLLIVNLSKKDGDDASAPFRGLTQDGFAVHPEIKLIGGRVFQPGVNEMIVGKSAQRLYKGLDVGSQIKLFGATWTVVGTFESGGTGRESELIADKQTLNSAYQRGNGEQSVWVVLDGPGGFQTFKDAITTNPQLQVDVSTEKDFGAQQASSISRILKFVAYVVGGIMAIGAIFGALNTMYSAVSTRSREIATLARHWFWTRAGGRLRFCRSTAPGLDRRRNRRADRVADVQRPFRRHARRRLRRTADIRSCGNAGAGGAGHHLGLRHRRHRRPVPGDSRRATAGGHGAARGVAAGT